MSETAEIELAWGDGDHVFRLGLGQLRELQRKAECGPFVLFQRFVDRSCKIDDVRETIRLGLIGGGLAAEAALQLVKDYFDGRPLMPHCAAAMSILGAALVGAPDDPVDEPGRGDSAPGKPAAAKGKKKAASPSPPSTAPEA